MVQFENFPPQAYKSSSMVSRILQQLKENEMK